MDCFGGSKLYPGTRSARNLQIPFICIKLLFVKVVTIHLQRRKSASGLFWQDLNGLPYLVSIGTFYISVVVLLQGFQRYESLSCWSEFSSFQIISRALWLRSWYYRRDINVSSEISRTILK